MNAWVRSESKTLRPFFGAEKAWKLLHDAAIVVEIGGEAKTEERIELGPEAMGAFSPIIFPRLSEEVLNDALGETRKAFSLAVTLRTPAMLRRELAAIFPLAGELPTEVAVPSEILKDGRLSGLCEIGLSICLSEQVELGLGWPSQVGGFVSQKTFVIGLDRSQSSFRILPLTSDIINRERLPSGTFVYVEVEDLNEVYEEGCACATAYVAEGVLTAASKSKNKVAVAALMQAEIISQILLARDNGVSEANEVREGSPLAAILENLLPSRKLALGELKQMLQDPSRFRAAVLDSIGVVGKLEKI